MIDINDILSRCNAIVYKNESKPDADFYIITVSNPVHNEMNYLREYMRELNLTGNVLIWRDSIADVQSMSIPEAVALRATLDEYLEGA